MLRKISKLLLVLALALSMVTSYAFSPSQDTYAMAKATKKTAVKSVTLNYKVITAKKKGTCKIYVFAQNGYCKTIKVTVK